MTTDLVLPGAISATALDLPHGLTYEKWAEVGAQLGQIERAVRWWVGDWLCYGELSYGEEYVQAAEAKGANGSRTGLLRFAGEPRSVGRITRKWPHWNRTCKTTG